MQKISLPFLGMVINKYQLGSAPKKFLHQLRYTQVRIEDNVICWSIKSVVIAPFGLGPGLEIFPILSKLRNGRKWDQWDPA